MSATETNGSPRHAGNRVPPASAKRSAAVGKQQPRTPQYDFLGAVIRRKYTLIIFVIIGALIGYAHFMRQTPIYASSLKLMIWNQTPPGIVDGQAMIQQTSLGKHENLLSSDLVLSNAINDGEFQNLKTFSGSSVALPKLKGMLSVTPVENAADTLVLTLKGPRADELPEMLQQVVDAYKSVLNEDRENIGRESVELMRKLEEKMSSQKSSAEQRYTELLQKLGLSSDASLEGFTNPYLEQAEQLKQQRSEKQREYRNITERMASVRDLQRIDVRNRDQLLKVVSIEAAKYLQLERENDRAAATVRSPWSEKQRLIDNLNSRITSIESKISELKLKDKKVSRSFAAGHPSVVSVRTDLEYFQGQLESLEEQRDRLTEELENASQEAIDMEEAAGEDVSAVVLTEYDKDLIRVYVSAMAREQERLESAIEGIDEEIAKLEEQASAISGDINKLNMLRREIDQKGRVIQDTLDRLSEITVVSGNFNSTKVRVIDQPKAGYMVEPKLLNHLLVASFLSGMLGFGLVLLQDRSDLSFRNPDEIYEKLGVPVVSRVPRIVNPQARKSDHAETLVLVDKPKSAAAEAIRTCRTAMLFAARQQQSQVFMVTSPSVGDGKTTTACNLAISFAQGGSRVALVDADLRRPRCHQYLGEDKEPGLKQLASGEAELDEVIRTSKFHEGMSFISSGGHVDDACEFLESSCFHELLDELRERFDYVLLDSPPILPVADTCSLVNVVDGVLTVIKIRKGVALASQKAHEKLDMVDAKHVGVLVNAVQKGTHYSEYGKYGYNGYGGYGYYAQRYYESENEKYYESEKSHA